jgi:hypothetical protein
MLNLGSSCHGGEWSASRPGRFTSGLRAPGTPWIIGRVSPRAGLDAVERSKNPSPCREPKPCCAARSLLTILTEIPRHTIMKMRLIIRDNDKRIQCITNLTVRSNPVLKQMAQCGSALTINVLLLISRHNWSWLTPSALSSYCYMYCHWT